MSSKRGGRKKTKSLGFKTTPEIDARLDRVVELTGISKSAIVLAAVEALVEAIERAEGVVFPVDFRLVVAREPTKRGRRFPKLTGVPTPETIIAAAKKRQSARSIRDELRAHGGLVASET